MAEVTLNPLDPGDALNAASVNNLMDGVKNAVNDIEKDALAPGTFNDAHLPSLVTDSGQVVVGDLVSLHTYTGAGWQLITHGGTALEVDLGATYSASSILGGALVLASINYREINSAVGITVVYFRVEAWNGAAWVAIDRSTRSIQTNTSALRMYRSIPIRTLAISTDSLTFSKFRVMVSLSNAARTIGLRKCTLSVLLLRGPRE